MSEEKLLKHYGCNSLSEFIDTYLDCETAFDLLRSQFKEIERLHSIIKEAREYITSIKDEDIQYTIGWVKQDILQILDKENNDIELDMLKALNTDLDDDIEMG